MSQRLLFTPLTIRSVTLRNRVVVAPMHQYAADRGFATDWHLMNVGRYAAGGCGLVMVESTKVERRGCGTVGDLGLWKDEFIPGLSRLAAFIKAQGATPAIQLGHSRRKARLTRPWEGQHPLTPDHPEMFDWDGWDLIAPSAIPHSDRMPMPRALSRAEIPDLVAHWGEAAARASKAGFEVLEIHGAHGYLDAAQKLGADPDFTCVPPAMGWWLGKRAKSAFEGVPSTYRSGIESNRNPPRG